MKKTVLKHLTVIGFVKGEDLTKCEFLEKKMDDAKAKLNYAKKEVEEAKQKLIHAKKEVVESKQKLDEALVESLEKVEKEKKDLKKDRETAPSGVLFSRGFSTNDIKNKYEEAITELELKKNEIEKRINMFKNDGSEKWESFKQKLTHDMEELGKALKSFTVYNQ
nr:hypothetical protein [uncultured Carboxylicivirga sp.]